MDSIPPGSDNDEIIRQLQAALTARDEFIAVAAHELRNPMTPIIAQVQLLLTRARRENASASMIGGLELLECAVDHYMRRATTLLQFTRLNAGRLKLELSTFDLSDLARECARSYQLLAVRAGSVISCDAPGPIFGTWDRLALEQVADNLVSNAIRYGDGKPVTIGLEAREDSVVLNVTDQGVGIATDDLDRIFDRFERASGPIHGGGFGIGLWLVHELVRAHSGSVQVRSQLGSGSTFSVHLPRHTPQAAQDVSERE